MAAAHALLTGELGVALVTSGPGVTNCVTSIANADLERASVLVIGGCPPARQDNMGPLQGTPHTEILRPVTRLARTLRIADAGAARARSRRRLRVRRRRSARPGVCRDSDRRAARDDHAGGGAAGIPCATPGPARDAGPGGDRAGGSAAARREARARHQRARRRRRCACVDGAARRDGRRLPRHPGIARPRSRPRIPRMSARCARRRCATRISC